MHTTDTLIHPDLLEAQKSIYAQCGFFLQNVREETNNKEYDACEGTLNNRIVKFRTAKITPIKTGLFVVFWKRDAHGLSVPYDAADPFDILIVTVRTQNHFGQFVFPKQLLLEQKIVSRDGRGGKRALRVYPPWDIAESKQAKQTQSWQSHYFFEIRDVNRSTHLSCKNCSIYRLRSNMILLSQRKSIRVS